MLRTLQCLALCAIATAALTAHAARGNAAKEAPKLTGVINLNQADFDQLTLLPGVGPTKARRIVEWRARHPFKRIEELTRVKGFGRKTFARLKAHLAVAGPSTAQRVRPAARPAGGAPVAPVVTPPAGPRPTPPSARAAR